MPENLRDHFGMAVKIRVKILWINRILLIKLIYEFFTLYQSDPRCEAQVPFPSSLLLYSLQFNFQVDLLS